MLDEINKALETYERKWQALISVRHDKRFFGDMKPTAVGWKVKDLAEYEACRDELHEKADKIIETWMNGRWIAKVHLKDSELANGASIIKLMQRRPDSSDALGLDHVDFYTTDMTRAESVLKNEPDLKWSWESNDVIASYDWLSIWFDDTEAKIKAGTVLDIIQKELNELNEHIIGQ